MNILFLGYWGANEGLSQATINPNLRILADFQEVQKIHYISIERNSERQFNIPFHRKIEHTPYKSRHVYPRVLNKFLDLIGVIVLSKKIINRESIDFLICRSSLAGVAGYYLHLFTRIQFAVESFEPHASYMLELGIWKKNGISYTLQSYWERCQKKTAKMLMPVTYNYSQLLIKEGVQKSRLAVMPCSVDTEMFKFDYNFRRFIRGKHRIKIHAKVGVYVGKFGGLYLDEKAFEIFRIAKEVIPTFFLFILTPVSKQKIVHKLLKVGFKRDDFFITKVEHGEVPKFLSASDFAFCLHNPLPSMSFVSPIKNGEYWSCGLPILMPKGIGDDSNIIESQDEAGVVFDLNESSIIRAIMDIQRKLGQRDSLLRLSLKYRNLSTANKVYGSLIQNK